jgi:hypothetical protein
VWHTTIAPHTAAILLVASAVIASACSPSIRTSAETLFKNTIDASQSTFNDHLVIVTEPSNTYANATISPAVVVEFVNSAGQVDTGAHSLVSLAIGTNPSAGLLNGTTSVVAVNGVATFSGLSINNVGNGYTLEVSATGVTSAPTTSFNITSGAPTQLVFSTEPVSAVSGASLGSISVKIEDSNGNLETSSVLPVTLAIGNNAGPGGTLSGSTTVNAVGGIATFPGLSIDIAGTGYTLVASSGSLTTATSTPFNISSFTATKLVFTTQPASTTSGASLGSVAVTVEDNSGNVITGSTASVTLAIGNNAGPGGTLSGTVTVSAVNGVATFPGLSINLDGTGYTLMAASSGLTGATSSAFNISSGAASQLAFTTQPSNTAAGASIGAIAVTVEDAAGNKVSSSSASITLAIGNNAGPGGVLSGTATVSAVSGVATFPGLSINVAGTGYTLTAASSGLTGSTSNAFNITTGAATQLVYGTQPASAAAGASLGSITVKVEDASGNVVTGSSASITLAIANNAGPGGVLSGTATVSAVNGIATFPGLNINVDGTGYTLGATSSGLTSATSSAFNITSGAASKLVFGTEPTNANAGASLGGITVKVEDASGNVVTGSSASITLAIANNAGPGGVLSGITTVSAVSGVATIPGLSINVDGTGYTLGATSSGLTSATSTAFNIASSSATQLVFGTEPANAAAGASLGSITVKVEDASGNVVTGSSASITLAIANNAGPGGVLSGTATVSAVSGIATFPGLNINVDGTGYTLAATSTGLTTATSSAFNITSGTATQLVFGTEPTNAAAGASLGSITVKVEDASGNVVTGSSASITLAIANNAGPGGVLSGTATVSATSGVATFPGLNINVNGTGYTLGATSSGLTSATSTAFNIAAGGATQLVFGTEPANAASGASLGSITVKIEDASGNVVTGSSASVTLAIANNAGPGGVLSGTATVSAVNGIATFPGLNINIDGTGYTLGATSSGLTSATSTAFNITSGSATQLVFGTEPTNAASGASLGSITVKVEDASGNVVTGSSASITLAIANNAGPGGVLSGTATVSATSGVATFPGLSINIDGTGYTLGATSSGLTSATSTAFNIASGTATQLVYGTEPANAAAGASLGSITVKVEDAAGNVVTSSSASITLAIANNAGPGGVLSGTATVSAVSGIATFSGLNINVDGTGYTLGATSSGLTSATSTAFNITSGTATQLVFGTQPVNAASGASLGSITVKVEDASGNVVTGSSASITLAIANNAGPGGVLSGTATVSAVSGVATIPGLNINVAGTGYTLAATSSGLTSATSSAFNITAGGATQVVFGTEPANAASGASLGSITAKIEDASGNVVTSSSASVTLAIGNNAGSPAGTLSGTVTVSAVSGIATIPGLSINNAGTGYTLTAASGVLTSATSTAFNITAGAATKVVFTTQPSNAAAGASLGSVVATIEDASGNTVTGSSANVTLAIGNNAGPGGVLSGTLTVAASSGVATFSGLSINVDGTGYTLTAASAGLTTGTSSAFNIAAGAATKVVFTAQPQNALSDASIGSITASIEDASGNVVTSSTASVTLAIANNAGTPAGTLSGTVTVSAISGVASFSGLSIDKYGNGYTLSAASSGLTSATSSSFNITVGAATQLAFTTEPANAASGASLGSVVVKVEDAGGNVVTTATNSITVAIGTNAGPGGTLSGTKVASAVSGVATFSGLNINLSGVGYTLTAAATGLSGTTSTTFNITAGTATKLVFTTQPSSVAANTSLGSVTVQVEDAAGNVVTTSSASIVMSISTNPGSGTLSGTKTISATSGVAVFSDLTINNGGTGYKIKATSSGLISATSSSFNITYPTPTSFSWSGSTNITSGTCTAYTIQAMNGASAAAFSTATTISLTGAGNGNFYGSTDSSCATPITSISIAANTSSITVYYEDLNVGAVSLTATAGSVNGSYTVTSTGLYVLSSNVSTGAVGSIFTMTITLENSLGGTITAPSNITMNVFIDASEYFTKFCGPTDSTCVSAAVTSVTIPAGQSSISYYFQDYRAQTVYPNTNDTSGYFNGSPGNIPLTVTPNNVSTGNIVITGPTFVTQGSCAAYTATVTDIYGNISPLSSAQTLALATSTGGQFYATSDTSCSSAAITTLPISSGATSAVFHFMDNTAPDSPTIGATASGFTGTTFNVNSVTSIPTIALGHSDDVSMCTIVNGDLQCWGDNAWQGIVGNGAISGGVSLPSQVLGLSSGVTSVAEAADIACAVANGGQYCWSGGGWGDTGGAAGENYNYPAPATGFAAGSGVTQTASGPNASYSSCILVNGGVYCTGNNVEGSLGNGTTSGNSADYVQVPAFPQGSGITNLYGAQDGYCVIINGGAECWGNSFTATPTYQIPQGSGVTTLAMLKDFTYAVIGGQIYSIDGPGSYSLFQGGNVTGVTKIATGYETSCALATGGTVYCWTYGSNPTQATGISGAIDVSTEGGSSCALFSDSEIKCWGSNYAGNLGSGTITDSPTTPMDTGSIYGGVYRVNQGAWGDLFVSGNAVTQSLGWTVASHDFLVVEVGGASSGSTINSVIAYAGATPYTMTLATVETGSHSAVALYYLPNASGITSVTVNYAGNNGADVNVIAAEYSGLSTTASVVGSAVTADSGYTNAQTWSVGPYTAPVGGLVLTGLAHTTYSSSETFTAGLGWNIVANYSAGTGGTNLVLEEQLKGAGSCTGTGSTSLNSYTYFDTFIVGFK